MDHRTNEKCPVSEQKILFFRRWKLTLLSAHSECLICRTKDPATRNDFANDIVNDANVDDGN